MRVGLLYAGVAFNLADLLSNPGTPQVGLVATPTAGNVDNGPHRYAIVFVSAAGDSPINSQTAIVTVVDKTVNGQVRLINIPIGPAGTTSRKVCRTSAYGLTYKLQSTIADNTTTVLTDNTADASLTGTALDGPRGVLDDKPPFFSDLTILADAANADDVALDVANPGIDGTNYGTLLGADTSYRFQGSGPVAPGDIWLFTATAEQYLHISGRPF